MNSLAKLDHAHVWHPFTQMRDWLRSDPIVLVSGKGSVLTDVNGREYLDANSSIWTNLHGHNHPAINAALKKQLSKVAHTSALGFANEPASLLAERLVRLADAGSSARSSGIRNQGSGIRLPKVFFSDDGSTALEVAIKLAYEFTRRTKEVKSPRFLAMDGAYHGDTVGAVSLGHIGLFHKAYAGLLFKSEKVMSPACYRCPFNRAKPERADARTYRQCGWECVGQVEKTFATAAKARKPFSAFSYEPLMQGAAGMIPQPAGWLGKVAEIARGHGALLIADEVMTGFGRVGSAVLRPNAESQRDSAHHDTSRPALFGSHVEGVQPDFLCVAKGLTGGYLPMAATLTTQAVFDAFLGDYEEFKTFFHGHSYTGNQLGAAAGLASMRLLTSTSSAKARAGLEMNLRDELKGLWALPQVGDIRQVGLVAGVELVRNWQTREAFPLKERAGIRVCEAMAKRGVLTRPIGNVVVLMPPYCATRPQVRRIVWALYEAVDEVFAAGTPLG